MLLAAALYWMAGVGSGALARAAASHAIVVAWRWAAWWASGIVFVAHIRHERSRFGLSRGTTAFHVSAAAALGACALAASALVHALSSATGKPRLLALALVIWPLLTAIPAFLVALVVATIFGHRDARRA